MSIDQAQTDDERFVLDFLGRWEHRDVEELLPFFTEDAWYIDMPLPPRKGIEEIRTYITNVFGAFGVRIVTSAIASRDTFIFTERIDYLEMGDTSVPLPVLGVMEMQDGKIHRWREYLDLGTAEAGLGIQIRASVAPGD